MDKILAQKINYGAGIVLTLLSLIVLPINGTRSRYHFIFDLPRDLDAYPINFSVIFIQLLIIGIIVFSVNKIFLSEDGQK